MAMMQPPGDTEFATRQDVQRVDEKIDRVDEKVQRLDEKVQRLDEKVQRLDEKVERVGEQVHRLETRFERMEEKFDAVLTVMREHMASKSDVERMARVFAMWLATATVTAVIAFLSRS